MFFSKDELRKFFLVGKNPVLFLVSVVVLLTAGYIYFMAGDKSFPGNIYKDALFILLLIFILVTIIFYSNNRNRSGIYAELNNKEKELWHSN